MWQWTKDVARSSFELLQGAADEYGIDRASRMAAAIAYRTIFALTPLLLVAVAVFGAIVGDSEEARQRIFDFIGSIAGAEVVEAVRTLVDSAVRGGDIAAYIGFALFLWTASSLFMEIQNDLNDIFDVPYQSTTGVVASALKRGIGFLWAIGLGLILVLIWAINLIWSWIEGLFPPELETLHRTIGLVTPLVSLALFPVLFGLIFQTLTRVKLRWRAVWVGGLFTSVVFVISALGAGLYFSWDSETSASRIAGAFFVVLLLAFLLSSVFLYGAEVTKVYNDRLDVKEGVVEPSAGTVEAEADESSGPLLVVFAFLSGLLVGWRKSRG